MLQPFAAEIRRRLGPAPELPVTPLVSIVVVNRDGVDHLRSLHAGLCERTDYSNLELILVDNASGDDSLQFLRTVDARFPISIVANHRNESFADANNQGAELARGELLLFLNNDVELFEPGWLTELIACLHGSGAGIAGATLLERSDDSGSSHLVVQQRGLEAREAGGLLIPDFREHGTDPLGVQLARDVECAATSAACSLVERGSFEAVGGFTHGYMYGVEDIDLALKLREKRRGAVSSGRSLVIHAPGSTLNDVSADLQRDWQAGNRQLFWHRWGPRVRREYELDRLDRRGVWTSPVAAVNEEDESASSTRPARAELEALGYCLKAAVPVEAEGGDTGDGMSLERLRAALERRGHRCLLLEGDRVDDLSGLNHDVAVHLRGAMRYVPKPSQLNVLWILPKLESITAIECSRYDLIVTHSEGLAQHLHTEGTSGAPVEVLVAEEPERLAEELATAVDSRARELRFPTTIDPTWASDP